MTLGDITKETAAQRAEGRIRYMVGVEQREVNGTGGNERKNTRGPGRRNEHEAGAGGRRGERPGQPTEGRGEEMGQSRRRQRRQGSLRNRGR